MVEQLNLCRQVASSSLAMGTNLIFNTMKNTFSLITIGTLAIFLIAFVYLNSQLEIELANCNKKNNLLVADSNSMAEFAFMLHTEQESYFYPDDVYRKLQEEGMPDSLAYMFTQVAIKEAGYGLNSQYASQYHNYWGRRDTIDHRNFMRFESNESAVKYMAERFSKCPQKDKYKWLEEDLNWCPGKGSCKNYYKKVRNIKF